MLGAGFPGLGLHGWQSIRPGTRTAAEQTPPTHPPPGPAFPGTPSPPATDSPRLAWPAPASLPHHTGTGTGTGGMEPARTMADLIRTCTDGNGARTQ